MDKNRSLVLANDLINNESLNKHIEWFKSLDSDERDFLYKIHNENLTPHLKELIYISSKIMKTLEG